MSEAVDEFIVLLKKFGLTVHKTQLHKPSPDRHKHDISLPRGIFGNRRYKYQVEAEWTKTEHAQNLSFELKNGKWWICFTGYLGGIPPWDLPKTFASFPEVKEFILEYYFGDPRLMNPPEYLQSQLTDLFWEQLRDSPTNPEKECRRESCCSPTILASIYCGFHHYEQIRKCHPPYYDERPKTSPF